MIVSSARVATERPTTYLKRLCEHFADEGPRHVGHELHVNFDDDQGSVDFAPVVSGSFRLDARQPGLLVLHATGTDDAALERVQRIVAEHVERFGQDEGLTVEWGPGSEEPATWLSSLTASCFNVRCSVKHRGLLSPRRS